MQMHGDAECRHGDGGAACGIRLFPDGYAMRLARPFSLQATVNDVRAESSPPLPWYFAIALRTTAPSAVRRTIRERGAARSRTIAPRPRAACIGRTPRAVRPRSLQRMRYLSVLLIVSAALCNECGMCRSACGAQVSAASRGGSAVDGAPRGFARAPRGSQNTPSSCRWSSRDSAPALSAPSSCRGRHGTRPGAPARSTGTSRSTSAGRERGGRSNLWAELRALLLAVPIARPHGPNCSGTSSLALPVPHPSHMRVPADLGWHRT